MSNQEAKKPEGAGADAAKDQAKKAEPKAPKAEAKPKGKVVLTARVKSGNKIHEAGTEVTGKLAEEGLARGFAKEV